MHRKFIRDEKVSNKNFIANFFKQKTVVWILVLKSFKVQMKPWQHTWTPATFLKKFLLQCSNPAVALMDCRLSTARLFGF